MSVRRTYSARSNRSFAPSSSPSRLSCSPPSTPPRKRPLADNPSAPNTPPTKRARLTLSSPTPVTLPSKTKATRKLKPVVLLNAKSRPKTTKTKQAEKKYSSLTQLHFSLDSSVLRTCENCDLTYTKGAPDDEALHKAHCARVRRGMEWGRDEEKESTKAGLVEIASAVKLKDGSKGRIVAVRADAGGKIGSKLATLLETIRLTLSSPALPQSTLRDCKLYLFLLPTSSSVAREKIVGCVIAQHISTAMAISSSSLPSTSPVDHDLSKTAVELPPPTATLVPIDTSTGLFCHPAPLPTPMGIPRLFVSSAHRKLGIATHLLNAAAATFIHGCKLDPKKGEVAFTQPTNSGQAVMQRWGKGGVRIYYE